MLYCICRVDEALEVFNLKRAKGEPDSYKGAKPEAEEEEEDGLMGFYSKISWLEKKEQEEGGEGGGGKRRGEEEPS